MKKGTITWLGERGPLDAHLRVGEDGDERVVEWPRLGTLRVRRDGSSPRFVAHPDALPVAASKIEHGVAAALARHLAGRVTLHGSAVRFGPRAVVCIGPSGAGKSSTGASLCLDHGGELLADDMAALDFGAGSITVSPTERTHTLSEAALARYQTLASDAVNWELKYVVPAPRVSSVPATLGAIVSLVFDDAIEDPVITPLRGHRLLAAVLPCFARFPFITDPDVHLRDLERLDLVAGRRLVYELRRPRDLPRIARSTGWICALLNESEDR